MVTTGGPIVIDPRPTNRITRLLKKFVMKRRKCPRCSHDKDQHTFQGCGYEEQRGGSWWQCPCKVTYVEIP